MKDGVLPGNEEVSEAQAEAEVQARDMTIVDDLKIFYEDFFSRSTLRRVFHIQVALVLGVLWLAFKSYRRCYLEEDWRSCTASNSTIADSNDYVFPLIMPFGEKTHTGTKQVYFLGLEHVVTSVLMFGVAIVVKCLSAYTFSLCWKVAKYLCCCYLMNARRRHILRGRSTRQ